MLLNKKLTGSCFYSTPFLLNKFTSSLFLPLYKIRNVENLAGFSIDIHHTKLQKFKKRTHAIGKRGQTNKER